MNKQIYYDKMSAQLDELEARINLAGAKVKSRAADVKIVAGKAADDLRSQAVRVRAKLDQLKNAAEGSWERMKDEIEAAWHDLDRRFTRKPKAGAKSDGPPPIGLA